MKRKRLKGILACMLALCMVFGLQSVAFAQEDGNTVVQKEVTDDATDTTTVTDKADDKTNDTGNTDTAGKDNADTNTNGETTEPNSGIAPASTDDDIDTLSDDTITWTDKSNNGESVIWSIENNLAQKIWTYTDQSNTNHKITISISENVLTVSGNGAMPNFVNSAAESAHYTNRPWNNESFSEIVFADGVTTTGENAFRNLNEVTKITLADSVLEVSYNSFGNLNALTSITLSQNLKSLTGLSNCPQLKSIILPESLETFGGIYALSGTGLESITIPSKVKELPTGAFYNCTSLETVSFAEGSSLETIGELSFNKDSALETIRLPDTVTSIGKNAFNGCSALKNVNIPYSVTTIGESAFKQIGGFDTLELGSSDLTIGNEAFYLTPIKQLVISDAKEIGTGAFSYIGAKVIVLCGTPGMNEANATPNGPFFVSHATSKTDQGGFTAVYLNSETVNANYLQANMQAICYAPEAVSFDVTDCADSSETKLAVPVRNNYIFKGWCNNKDENGNGTGDIVTTLEKNKIYYAKWEPKTESPISFNDSLDLNKTYDGQPVSISANDYTVTGDNREVTFAYQVKDENGNWQDITSAPMNAGTYQVKAIVAEDDTYASTESDWKDFEISKATPIYTAPAGLTATAGQTLADVELPKGFTWQDAATTSVGTAGTNTFKVTYTPENTDNYNTVTDIEVTITVKAKDTQKPTTGDNKNQSGTNTNKNTGNTNKTTSNSAKTGDTTNMALWIALIVLSGGLAAITAKMKRKR